MHHRDRFSQHARKCSGSSSTSSSGQLIDQKLISIRGRTVRRKDGSILTTSSIQPITAILAAILYNRLQTPDLITLTWTEPSLGVWRVPVGAVILLGATPMTRAIVTVAYHGTHNRTHMINKRSRGCGCVCVSLRHNSHFTPLLYTVSVGWSQ